MFSILSFVILAISKHVFFFPIFLLLRFDLFCWFFHFTLYLTKRLKTSENSSLLIVSSCISLWSLVHLGHVVIQKIKERDEKGRKTQSSMGGCVIHFRSFQSTHQRETLCAKYKHHTVGTHSIEQPTNARPQLTIAMVTQQWRWSTWCGGNRKRRSVQRGGNQRWRQWQQLTTSVAQRTVREPWERETDFNGVFILFINDSTVTSVECLSCYCYSTCIGPFSLPEIEWWEIKCQPSGLGANR